MRGIDSASSGLARPLCRNPATGKTTGIIIHRLCGSPTKGMVSTEGRAPLLPDRPAVAREPRRPCRGPSSPRRRNAAHAAPDRAVRQNEDRGDSLHLTLMQAFVQGRLEPLLRRARVPGRRLPGQRPRRRGEEVFQNERAYPGSGPFRSVPRRPPSYRPCGTGRPPPSARVTSSRVRDAAPPDRMFRLSRTATRGGRKPGGRILGPSAILISPARPRFRNLPCLPSGIAFRRVGRTIRPSQAIPDGSRARPRARGPEPGSGPPPGSC